MSVIGNNL